MNIREAIRASGGLVSLTTAADRVGVTRQRMAQYQAMEGFPDVVPVEGDTRVRLYFGQEIEEWLRNYRSGTPRTHVKSLDNFERGF